MEPPQTHLRMLDEQPDERLCIGLLLAAVLLAYANSLVNAFTMDDISLYIVRNPQVIHPSLAALFSPHQATQVFRPLTFLTFALDWKIGAGRPLLFHLVNMILHAAVTWLLYFLLRTILQSSPHGKIVAFVSALLFAVHPIHTEAVTSIVGRAELLAAGLLFAAWILHIRDREIAALLCLELALLSKESALVFLPLVALGDYTRANWKPASRYLRIAAVTALNLAWFWKIQGGHFGTPDVTQLNNPLGGIPPAWRILNALRVGWKYIGLQLYPATLSPDYSFNQIPVYRDLPHTLFPAVAFLVLFGGWIWAIRERKYGAALAGGIYLIGFSVTANIIAPIGTIMGERLAYLPSAGFCLLIALAWNWLRDRHRNLAWGLLAALIAILGARTVLRNRDWKDNLALYSAAVNAVPHSARMHEDLGATYAEIGKLDLARQELQMALSIEPDFPYALEAAGLVESWQHNYQAAGPLLEKALRLSTRRDPNYDDMTVNLAAVYLQQGNIRGALDILNREISEAPGYARAWANRAVIHYKQGETRLARADAEMALRLDPANQQSQNLLRLLSASKPYV
jgi:tetratricopeptide (TPR) repeat protein